MANVKNNSIYNPVMAKLTNRLASYVMDVILYLVLFTGVLYLCVLISSLDEYQTLLNDEYIRIGYKYFDETKDAYVTITNTDANFNAVMELYKNSEVILTYEPKVTMIVMNTPLIAIAITSLILELILPLIFKNGQTIGMKCFKLALISKSGIAISLNQIFVRFLFGRVVLMKMIPYLCLFFAFFNPAGGLFGLVMLIAILLGNLILVLVNKNKCSIPDLLVSVYMVDATQTAFYKTLKEKDEAIKHENKILSSQKKVY